MKSAAISLLLSMIISACAVGSFEGQKISGSTAPEISSSKSRSPVLVELFTSEGCSSCPPADRALAFLEKEQPFGEADIITLALHVDYWDYLGWRDEFSSPLFTRRQEIYAQKFNLDSTYTPQMVVDGEIQFVGSDQNEAAKAIQEAAKKTKIPVEAVRTDNNLKIKIADLPKHENATVFLAIAEDNLSADVKRGENANRKLEHISVVRELSAIGAIKEQDRTFEIETPARIKAGWKKENIKFVVFVQENTSRKIIGLAKIF